MTAFLARATLNLNASSQRRAIDDRRLRLNTLSCFALALQVQDIAPIAGTGNIVELLLQTHPVNQVVLGLLLFSSIVSWVIIFLKYFSFKKVEEQTTQFFEVFHRSSKFSEVQEACSSLLESPLVGVFQAGYAEMNSQFHLTSSSQSEPSVSSGTPTLKSLDAVDRALIRAAASETNKLEQRLIFLATTASAAPFIGLFGTVWGIMIAFQKIGITGSTNIAVVAPGISEALVATAAGLLVAIPAVYSYNYFTNRLKIFSSSIDDFMLEFLNIAERNFT